MASSIPERSIEVQILVDALIALKMDEQISYEALGKLIGCNVQFEHRHRLTSAVNIALNQHGIVIATIHNVGVKRLNDIDAVGTMHHHLRRMRKASRKQAKRLTSVDYDNLPKKQQVEHNAGLAVIGVMLHMTAPKQQAKLESHIERTGKRISVANTIGLFGGKVEA